MNRLAMTGVLGVGLLLAAGAALAQNMGETRGGPMGGPMGRWWERPRVAEQIGLTQEQTQKLEAITLDEAHALVDLKGAVQKAEIDLRAASDVEPFQPAKVREAFRVMQQARVKLETERFEMLLKVRQVLSADQWHKLHELLRERVRAREREEGEGRGPHRRPE
jgi:Spy/CpxP family protein refolding chaperone